MMACETSKKEINWLAKWELIDTTLGEFLNDLTEPAPEVPHETQQVLAVVHSRLFDPDLNVSAVRRWCNIKNNGISSRFRLVIGVGLRDYIENRRIEAAKRLLEHVNIEVYLIAMAVGYTHSETFFRAFRRQEEALTPQEWREQELAYRRTHVDRSGRDVSEIRS